MTSAVARADAKWILFGEHLVVAGSPAIAFPLPTASLVVTAHVGAGGPVGIRLESHGREPRPGTGGRDPGALRLALRLVGRRLRALPGPLSVVVSSTIPIGAGLGSSAALVVAMTDALHRLGVADGQRGLARLRALERIFHAHSSGLDTAVVSVARPLRFASLTDWAPLTAEIPPALLVVPGDRRRAGDLVKRAAGRLTPGIADDYLALLAGGLSALQRRDWETLGAAMDENQTLLERLGVVTDLERGVREWGRDKGCLGAKVTGAGGGGAVALLHPDPAWLAHEARQMGWRALPARSEDARLPRWDA